MKNLGNKIAAVATPVARALKLPCIDPNTQELRPESPCAKAKQRLNNGEPFWDVMYDRFWAKNVAIAPVDELVKTGDTSTSMEEYLVNKTTTEQIAIKAKSMDEAEEKAAKGEGEIISRNKTITSRPRPGKPTAATAGSGQLPPNMIPN